MKHILAAALLVLSVLFASCGTNGSHDGHPADTSARIVGTVVDAATGTPVANVKVEGPNDRSTRSDSQGRFEFKDLEVGTRGEVKAALDDGRKGSVALRPLASGSLEIVLHLFAR